MLYPLIGPPYSTTRFFKIWPYETLYKIISIFFRKSDDLVQIQISKNSFTWNPNIFVISFDKRTNIEINFISDFTIS